MWRQITIAVLFCTGRVGVSWSNLLDAAERVKFTSCLWRTIQNPAAVGAAAIAGVALAVIALGPAAVAAGIGVMMSVAQFAGAHGRSGPEADVVPIDQYRKLDKYFAAAAENDRVVQALCDLFAQLGFCGEPILQREAE